MASKSGMYSLPMFGVQTNASLSNAISYSPSGRGSPSLREKEDAVLHTFDFLDSVHDSKPSSEDASAPWSDAKSADDVRVFVSLNAVFSRF